MKYYLTKKNYYRFHNAYDFITNTSLTKLILYWRIYLLTFKVNILITFESNYIFAFVI